ncbi:MAG: flagellar filament capping protein FliD [Candidatus Omnitrophota bacterium]
MSSIGSMSSGSSISGQLDVQYIVEQIIYSKQQPIRELETYETFYTAKKTAFQELNTKVSAVESALYAINSSGFETKKATLNSETNLTASASTTAANGTYSIAVKQLARSQSSVSTTFSSATDQTLSHGKVTIKDHDGTNVLGEVDFSTGTLSLNQLRDQINSLDLDVTATVINFGTSSTPDYRLQITSDNTGTENGFTIVETNAGGGTLPAMTTSIAATDAQFYINSDPATGTMITRSSNTVTDVISGVTLNLKQPLDAEDLTLSHATTLTVSADSSALKEKIETFVTAFNDTMDFLNAQFTFDEKTQQAGVLSGESTAVQIKGNMLSMVADRIGGIDDSEGYKTLSTMGVSLNRTGHLEIDDTKLDHMLSDHMDVVTRMFKNVGESTNAEATYIGSSTATVGGKYQLYVTRAAEQATIQGAENIATLGQDEELTITYGGKNYTVSLTAGMTSSQVVEEINSTMDTAGIGVTAQLNGSKLEIVTDEYGSSQSLTVVSDVDAADPDGSTGIGTGALSDTGVDVAGKFKDATGTTLTASGSGTLLTGTSGGATGLIVNVSTSSVTDAVNGDSKGEIYFTRGIGETLRKRMSDISMPYIGSLAHNIDSLDNQLQGITDKISDINRNLAVEEEMLIKQFTQANEAMANMNYMLSQMKGSSSS